MVLLTLVNIICPVLASVAADAGPIQNPLVLLLLLLFPVVGPI